MVPQSSRIIKYLSILLVQVLLTAMISGCGAKKEDTTHTVKNVKTITAALSSLDIKVEYAGKVRAAEEVVVSPKIAGKVAAVKADVGEKVEKGQVLFTLDPKDADTYYKQSQAGLDAANANLKRTGDSALSQQILQGEASVKQAQVMYDDAKSFYDKIKSLYDSGAVSKQQLDDAESKYKNAGIQLDTAKDNLNLLKGKAGPQSVNVASAQVEQAKASVDQASLQLENTTIASPINGIVAARNIDEGEMVSNTVPAFTVMDTKSLSVEFGIPENAVGGLKKGQNITLRIDALKNKELQGIVDIVSPAADPRTQSYTIKIKLQNPDDAVKPGMFARVLIPAEKRENVLSVPNEAIVIENGVQYVYAVTGGKVKKKAVETGLSTDRITEITQGLEAGENVITEGQSFLNDGEAVNILK